jgi:uncharacterized protein YkwD
VALTSKTCCLLALAVCACAGLAHAQATSSAPAEAARAVLDRVNHYRSLAGAPRLAPHPGIQAAAQSHAQYMAELGQLGHLQGERTSPHYIGAKLEERLRNAGVTFARSGEAVGLATRSNPAIVVDDLISTVYHRLLLLAPDFASAGAGVARGEENGLEVVYVAIDLAGGDAQPAGATPSVATYPADRQDAVPGDFDPSTETPNPMPDQELVGQPISIQATQDVPLVVEAFRLTEAGGAEPVEAKLLTRSNDMQMPVWAAALVPLQPLRPGTAYEARFSGSIAGVPVERTWRFATASTRSISMSFAAAVIAPGGTQTVRLRNVDPAAGSYYICYEPQELIRETDQESFTRFRLAVNRCAQGSSCTVTIRAGYDRACTQPFARGSFRIGG